MARLNDVNPPAPSECIESLKRRFLRQNRELARVNSNQSVRMRALETQVSQLVAENGELRIGASRLQLELDNLRARDVFKQVEAIRSQLAAKLGEVRAIVDGLDEVGKRVKRRRSSAGPIPTSPKNITSTNYTRTERGMREILDYQQEGRLPTIAEGKYFPRRTLETIEIDRLLQPSASKSPDLGPPPTTCLELDTPAPRYGDTLERLQARSEEVPASGLLSANFETRRRRRDTSGRRDSSFVVPLDSSPIRTSEAPENLRADEPRKLSAKRKLDTCDQPAEILPLRHSTEVLAAPSRGPIVLLSPRRALASKPVNTDTSVSPQKKTAHLAASEKPPTRDVSVDTKHKATSRNQRSDVLLSVPPKRPSPDVHVDLDVAVVKHEPLTPRQWDPSQEFPRDSHELQRDIRGDTPPPAYLARRKAGDSTDTGRGSRRARANISYAEPSLISKMRRPSNHLVDAVTKDQRKSINIQDGSGDLQTVRDKLVDMADSIVDRRVSTSLSCDKEKRAPEPEPTSPLARRNGRGRSEKHDEALQAEKGNEKVARAGRTTVDVFDMDALPSSEDVKPERRPRVASETASAGGGTRQLNRAAIASTLGRTGGGSRRQTGGLVVARDDEAGQCDAEEVALEGVAHEGRAAGAASTSLPWRTREERGLGRRRSTVL